MKFYRVYSNHDPAESDALFPTLKEAKAYKKQLEDGEWTVELTVIERPGRLTKQMVCDIYALAIR